MLVNMITLLLQIFRAALLRHSATVLFGHLMTVFLASLVAGLLGNLVTALQLNLGRDRGGNERRQLRVGCLADHEFWSSIH